MLKYKSNICLVKEGEEMDRTILHVDANSFYASVECFCNPDIRSKPVAVVGNPENRHGIILAANYIAKGYGVKTAEVIWQAKAKCPELVMVRANMERYRKFSQMMREIFCRYSDLVEPFGSDEAWVDVTHSGIFGSGEEIAKEIMKTVKYELGIGVSIGVSFNKVFAKLGSDYKKPEGITVITRENFKDIVWELPVSNLLYVGKKCTDKLNMRGIYTIGQLAQTDEGILRSWLGKHGTMLYNYANGYDVSEVKNIAVEDRRKSISNSTTTREDLTNNEDVKVVMSVLCASVAKQMRKEGVRGKNVSVWAKNSSLAVCSKQKNLDFYTSSSTEILSVAMELFCDLYKWKENVRALGVAVSDFKTDEAGEQLDLFGENEHRIKREKLETAVDGIEQRFGKGSIKTATEMRYTKFK